MSGENELSLVSIHLSLENSVRPCAFSEITLMIIRSVVIRSCLIGRGYRCCLWLRGL